MQAESSVDALCEHATCTCPFIDDFGAGYSSLSYLRRFPVNVFDIDRSFFNDITTDPDAAAIEQLNTLREQGRYAAQDHFVARPMPVAVIECWMRAYGGSATINAGTS